MDPNVTVDIIRNGHLAEKRRVGLPTRLTNVLFCKNPRCITTTEQELPHVFLLTDAVMDGINMHYSTSKSRKISDMRIYLPLSTCLK